MAKKIAIFKTSPEVSTAGFIFHLSLLLAQGGHCVLMVDADPQCNLTSLVLQWNGESGFEEFYQSEPARNNYAGLSSFLEQNPGTIVPIECLPITSRNDLFLLPGNVRLVEYERYIKRCQNLPETEQPSYHCAWALSHLIEVTAAHHNVDFVLIDMGASTGILNRDILMNSDFFMIMATPGISAIALDQIPSVFARWHAWYEKSKDIQHAQPTCDLYTDRLPKFLGMIIQEHCPRNSPHAEILQNDTEYINRKVRDQLFPELLRFGMVIPEAWHEGFDGLQTSLLDEQFPEIAKRIAETKANRKCG